mmetsp:Transcript_3157/g.6977  ORF Transcript_3157/g.6977 Transcript_3157/m.6977 type:complete len:218 (+) Transcript_3157:265-918(+)|eukprot:CAMPEP_0172317126 /NCGR_PEP_ID=MMETSP1058-20130122/30604_1 /TAXON_ID=83371 /ORGANISM="Detonula confervacea, Strain CCMP 353" /LENGTH=217 /DNA_ID=CAMNT_0013031605 /DNA_START=186 /DNA_END=839 /DNA_ORIENTATION=+
MNDTTLPIPSKKPNPRRRTEKGLRPGFGLHDWMTLLRHAKDLAQRKGAPIRRDISLAEVKTHNKPYDGWMVLRGKVYNITPYLAYHPGGGAILEKCVGRDATALFDRYHSWVNIDGLVGPLLLGYLLLEKKKVDDENDGGYLKGKVVAGASSSANTTSGDGNTIVMPAAASKTTSATESNGLGFAMPKPRPPQGEPMASLLPRDDDEDENEDDMLKL